MLRRCSNICLICITVLLLAACGTFVTEPETASLDTVPTPEAGDPARGQALIQNYGCGACHTIPGIPGANTVVGPSLALFAERRYIAGSLINTPENAATWIQNPHAVEPDTAMPNIGVTGSDAQDIVAYLYTLR